MSGHRITPPQCLLDACRRIFPKLDFGAIGFVLGMPPLHSGAGLEGLTLPNVVRGGVTIHLVPEEYSPAGKDSFVCIAHELVHAYQVQRLGGRTFKVRYAEGIVASGFGRGRPHPLEEPAYAYEDKLEAALDAMGVDDEGPCARGPGAAAFHPRQWKGRDFIDALVAQDPTLVWTGFPRCESKRAFAFGLRGIAGALLDGVCKAVVAGTIAAGISFAFTGRPLAAAVPIVAALVLLAELAAVPVLAWVASWVYDLVEALTDVVVSIRHRVG